MNDEQSVVTVANYVHLQHIYKSYECGKLILESESMRRLEDELDKAFPLYATPTKTFLSIINPPNIESLKANMEVLRNLGLIINPLNLLTEKEVLEMKFMLSNIDEKRKLNIRFIYNNQDEFNNRFDYLQFMRGEIQLSRFGLDYEKVLGKLEEESFINNRYGKNMFILTSGLLLGSNMNSTLLTAGLLAGAASLLSLSANYFQHEPYHKYLELTEKVRRADKFIEEYKDKILINQ